MARSASLTKKLGSDRQTAVMSTTLSPYTATLQGVPPGKQLEAAPWRNHAVKAEAAQRTPLPGIELLRRIGLPAAITVDGLPLGFHLDFSRVLQPLPALDSLLEMEQPSWARLFVFGDERFDNGGAFHCIDRLSGGIFRVDVDRDDGEELINPSLGSYLRCLQVMLESSRHHDTPPKATALVGTKLAANEALLDPPDGFWLALLECMTSYPGMRWSIPRS